MFGHEKRVVWAQLCTWVGDKGSDQDSIKVADQLLGLDWNRDCLGSHMAWFGSV